MFIHKTQNIYTLIETFTASIKWFKPVRLKQLQLYIEKKLDWIESYTLSRFFHC